MRVGNTSKHVASLLAFIFLLLLAAGSSESGQEEATSTPQKQWFQGGTLHNATLAEWKVATYGNKLATAGDWLAATSWKGHLDDYGNFEKLKVCAARLVNAIDEVSKEDTLGDQKANEVAAVFVTTANDLGPY